ncbi:MAG: hypothetical protein ABW047_17240 [Nitrospiraceae bacterium]
MTRRSHLGILVLLCTLVSLPNMIVPIVGTAEVANLAGGQWSGGGGLGFLGGTPDGIAEFAMNGHADYFMTPRFSVGPLAQYAGTGNDFMFGLSVQVKGWWNLSNTGNRLKLVLQGGFGFINAGIKDTDSQTANTYGSFLIPVGVGFDYAMTPRIAVTADLLLNFTSLGETLHANGREFDLHTNLMPGFYLGVRF